LELESRCAANFSRKGVEKFAAQRDSSSKKKLGGEKSEINFCRVSGGASSVDKLPTIKAKALSGLCLPPPETRQKLISLLRNETQAPKKSWAERKVKLIFAVSPEAVNTAPIRPCSNLTED
jgi:hypothetical protein